MDGFTPSNLQREVTDNLHIRRYDRQYFYLTDGREFHNSAIGILNESVYTDLLPESFDELTEAHFEKWLALNPTLILIGTGNKMAFLDPKWQTFFYQKGIGIETMPTDSLCRTFAILAVEDRNALGLFFPLTEETKA